jgi:hypothetical protein
MAPGPASHRRNRDHNWRTAVPSDLAVRGTSDNPMEAVEVESKALDLVTPVIGKERAEGLVAAVASLERLGSVRGLRGLLQA